MANVLPIQKCAYHLQKKGRYTERVGLLCLLVELKLLKDDMERAQAITSDATHQLCYPGHIS